METIKIGMGEVKVQKSNYGADQDGFGHGSSTS